MQAAHSKIGASTCERWWNCPGSVALVSRIPAQPPSAYAAEGTAAHEMAERALRVGTDAHVLVGQSAKNGIEFTDEMAEHVQVYLDTIRNDFGSFPNASLQIEHKFHLTSIHPDAFGTNDANIRRFMGRLTVYDYKHGAGVAVDAEENKQMLYYALGAAQEGDFDEIELVIVQPRAQHRDGPVRRWLISTSDLEAFAKELKERIAETKEDGAELRDGKWCHKTFCPALSICPKVRKNVEVSAGLVFDDLDEKKSVQLPSAETLTPLALRRLLDAAALIDAWIKSIEAHALGQAMRGEHVIDYKLVRKRSTRKWGDEALVEKNFEKLGDDRYNKKLKSPAQMEKLGKEVKKQVADLTVTPEAGLVLVHESDPREAVTPNALNVFSEITPNEIN